MFNLMWESEPPDYGVAGATLLGYLVYNAYLLEPPRVYNNEIYRLLGLFVMNRQGALSSRTIVVPAWKAKTFWPGWETGYYTWDSETGECLGWTESGLTAGYYTGQFYEGMGGTLWTGYLQSMVQVDPATLRYIGSPIPASKYGRISFRTPFVDLGADLYIDQSEDANNRMQAYRFSTGEPLYWFYVNGLVIKVCPESKNCFYVMTSTDLNATTTVLSLVNYITGKTLSVARSPVNANWNGGQTFMAWDQVTKRLMFFGPVVNDETGAAITTIKGYLPIPKITKLTKPIPLVPPRKGRTVPYLSRSVGDVGEPLNGGLETAVITGAAATFGPPGIATQSGYVIAQAQCTDTGTANVDISMEVL